MEWCDKYEVAPLLRTATQHDRNQVMALFALSLAQGSTILAISIKAEPIKGYLRAAAGLSKHAQLADPTRNFEGRLAEPI